MTTPALILYLIVVTTVCGLCGYFFFKVLTTKKHDDPDSYSDN